MERSLTERKQGIMKPTGDGFWFYREIGAKKWDMMYVQAGKRGRTEAKLYRGSNWRDCDKLEEQWFPCFGPEDVKDFIRSMLNCVTVRDVAKEVNTLMFRCGLRIKSDANKLLLRITHFKS